MSQDDDPQQIPTVEELDGEPRGDAPEFQQRTRTLEMVLGMLLLLGVLGYAGWQWWSTENSRSHYDQGRQAAQANHWDQARSQFAQAGGYKDSAALAEQAKAKIQERDKHYAQAQVYIRDGKWVDALSEIRDALRIEPDYRDLPQLRSVAESHVYDDVLLGAIVQRPSANPPGLYYGARSGWVWLKGSDAYSSFQSSSVDGNGIAYDVPGPGWTPPTTPPSGSTGDGGASGSGDKAGRGVDLAWIDPSVTSSTLKVIELPRSLKLLDQDGYSPLWWGKQGIWVTDNKFYDSRNSGSPVYQAITPISPLTYLPFDSSAPIVLTPTGTLSGVFGKPALLTSDSSYDDLLLFADWETKPDGGTVVSVYLTDASGTRRRTLYTHTGGIQKAQFSNDGKHILLVTTTPKSVSKRYDLSLVLLDAAGMQEPVVLAEQHGLEPYYSEIMNGTLQSVYIDKGPFAGKVLVTEWISGTNRVTLLDPANPRAPVSSITLQDSGVLDWTSLVSDPSDNRLLLFGYPYARSSSGPKSPQDREVLVTVNEHGGVRVHDIEVPVRLDFMMLQGTRFLFRGEGWPTPSPTGESFSMSTFPASGLDLGTDEVIRPQFAYSATIQFDDPARYTGAYPVFGEGALAYLQGRDLHVRAYETQTDLVLLSGISALLPFRADGSPTIYRPH